MVRAHVLDEVRKQRFKGDARRLETMSRDYFAQYTLSEVPSNTP